MRRRQFLSPKLLGRAAAELLDVAQQVKEVVGDTQEHSVLLRFARRAMATTFEVVLPLGTTHAQYLADAALDEIDRLEAQLTVYRADSDVSRLNERAAVAPVEVDARLFELLIRAQRLWQETDGAFDITLGALIKAWGFFRRQGRVPAEQDLAQARQCSGFAHVHLDAERRSVSFDQAGVEINLGSIGKGYAVDQAVANLRRQFGVTDLLIHGGHSSVVALGNEPGLARGWSIGLRDPDDHERRLAVIRLHNRALGVSAAAYQHFVHEGRKLGHILDPRSGQPARGVRLAAVTAPSAAEADALATAFYILGVHQARAYCESHPEIGAALLPEGGDKLVVTGRFAEEV